MKSGLLCVCVCLWLEDEEFAVRMVFTKLFLEVSEQTYILMLFVLDLESV